MHVDIEELVCLASSDLLNMHLALASTRFNNVCIILEL